MLSTKKIVIFILSNKVGSTLPYIEGNLAFLKEQGFDTLCPLGAVRPGPTYEQLISEVEKIMVAVQNEVFGILQKTTEGTNVARDTNDFSAVLYYFLKKNDMHGVHMMYELQFANNYIAFLKQARDCGYTVKGIEPSRNDLYATELFFEAISANDTRGLGASALPRSSETSKRLARNTATVANLTSVLESTSNCICMLDVSAIDVINQFIASKDSEVKVLVINTSIDIKKTQALPGLSDDDYLVIPTDLKSSAVKKCSDKLDSSDIIKLKLTVSDFILLPYDKELEQSIIKLKDSRPIDTQLFSTIFQMAVRERLEVIRTGKLANTTHESPPSRLTASPFHDKKSDFEIAKVAYSMKDWPVAIRKFTSVLASVENEIKERPELEFDTEHMKRHATALRNLGSALLKNNQAYDAEPLLQRALDIAEKIHKREENFNVDIYRNRLAECNEGCAATTSSTTTCTL